MINKSTVTKSLSLTLGLIALVLAGGVWTEGMAQSGRDPFAKPGYKKKSIVRPPRSNSSSSNKSASKNNASKVNVPVKPKGPVVVAAPSIEERIEYYKRIREEAAINGQAIPKVTSVLLVNEMTVSGIFKTPRGYAAMIEATPIKLSYTIYPGEKFFDGQLVAVEENRLIFRKVRKLSNGKFVSSVENKALRKYSIQQEIQGTAPSESRRTESANNSLPNQEDKKEIISPLDEMKRQPAEDAEKAAKDAEKDKKGKRRKSSRKKSRVAKKN